MADIPTNAANLQSGATDTGAGIPTSAPQLPSNLYTGWGGGIIGDLLGFGDAYDRANTQAWNVYNAQRQAYEYERNLEFNAAEAQKQRDFEEYLSNTQVARRMADLKAAGVNPLLALGGAGASTPSGSAANVGSTSKVSSNSYHGGSAQSAGALMSGIGAIIKATAKAGAVAAGEMIAETAPEWFMAIV